MKYIIYFLIFILSLGYSFGETISSLPYTIDKSGYYLLDTSTELNSNYAIIINANNVVLDGDQNIVKGHGEFGIIANGKNITINNITLIGWNNGILMTSNDTVLNNVNVIKNESLLKIKIDNPYVGILSVMSSPNGELYINNRYVKNTPCEIKLKPGLYSIIVYNESENKIYSKEIKVDKGIKYIIQPKLTSMKPKDTTTFNGIFKEPISIGISINKNQYRVKENGNILVKIKNPKINNKKLVVEECHKLPERIFIGVQGYEVNGGLATKSFLVYPSDNEFIDKLQFSFNNGGKYIFLSKVIYYPEGNKSLYKNIELAEVVNVKKSIGKINNGTSGGNGGIYLLLIVAIMILGVGAGIYYYSSRKGKTKQREDNDKEDNNGGILPLKDKK